MRQRAGKVVAAFAVEADLDPAMIKSSGFLLEWPPASGRLQTFPEVDEARWFRLDQAMVEMLTSQRAFVDRLTEILGLADCVTLV